MHLPKLLIAVLLVMPAACSSDDDLPPAPPAFLGGDEAQPAMRWDHRPEASQWTASTMQQVLSGAGQPLTSVVPSDIGAWCPSYAQNDKKQRAMFWVGLLSAMAKHESTWNPAAVGGGGQWFGLVQISPSTARGYRCGATSGDALKDGAANLSCAIRIMAQTVPRDGVVAAGGRGVAADWGPFHSTVKQADMMAWTTSQGYCR